MEQPGRNCITAALSSVIIKLSQEIGCCTKDFADLQRALGKGVNGR